MCCLKTTCWILVCLSYFGEIYSRTSCSDYVEFQVSGDKKQAIVTHAGPGMGITNLTVFYGIPGELYEYDGNITLVKDAIEAAQDGLKGKDIQYLVDFPRSKEFPIVLKLELNGKEICKGPDDTATQLSYIPNPKPRGSKPFNNRTHNQLIDSPLNFNTLLIPPYIPSQSTKSRPIFDSPTTNTPTPRFPPYKPRSTSFIPPDWLTSSPPPQTTKNRPVFFDSPTTNTPTTRREPITPSSPSQRENRFPIAKDPPSRATNHNAWLQSLPIAETCGRRTGKVGVIPTIINGQETIPGEFPWVAALFFPIRRQKEFFCGGTLISDRIVLTAAHCLVNRTVIYLELGRHNINDNSELNTIHGTYTSNFVIHPDYEIGANNDIGLIHIDPVQITHMIKPICLWPLSISFDRFNRNAEGTVTGWGRLKNDGNNADVLQKVKLKKVGPKECRESDPELQKIATDNTFCAGGNLQGPCHGDSGGGFFQYHKEVWYLRGIISHSLGTSFTCALHKLAVYTDIIYYMDWIKPYLL